jgi:hypothetical protein
VKLMIWKIKWNWIPSSDAPNDRKNERTARALTHSGLEGCNFQGNSVNPYLWTKYTEHRIVFVGINVDDCLVIGNENGIYDVIDGLKN